MKIYIKNKSKFALIGHGYHLNTLFDELILNKFPKPIIITHLKKYHKRDIREAKGIANLYKSVIELEKKTKVYYLKTLDSKSALSILSKNKVDYIFSCTSRFIFKDNIINQYKNKIFNIHGAILPEEKGGGIFTYRIFNKKKFCAATIHLIDKGIDTGDILLASKKKKVNGEILPKNFLIKTNKVCTKLIKLFIKKIINHKRFILKKQNPSKGFYLPRFYTDVSGAINWNWSGENINLFIKGCSTPYSGAFCFVKFNVKDIKVKILNSKFVKTKDFIHPWFSGKIINEDDLNIRVLTSSGHLIINKKDIVFKKNYNLKKFEGKTFYNTHDFLLNSVSHTPNVFKYKL